VKQMFPELQWLGDQLWINLNMVLY
jgi:hypothetical protein